ncbi:MAG TPA: universal stress protein [Geminicoccaceae bacterium]
MTYRTILIELQPDGPIEARLRSAQAVARRFEAMLIGMHVMATPFVPGTYGEAGVYLGVDLIEEQREASRRIAGGIRSTFQEICGTEGSWQEAEGDPGRLLAGAAHCADLVVAAKRDLSVLDMPDVVEELAVAAGVPVLMLPPEGAAEPARAVVVGWNGSREATRAVHGALPFLRDAERVNLCALGEEAARTVEACAAMLRRHDVAAEAEPLERPDGDAGEVLLAQAVAHGSDLLVMGAYGHGRLRELVFGGATRHVLRHATLPVLFGS